MFLRVDSLPEFTAMKAEIQIFNSGFISANLSNFADKKFQGLINQLARLQQPSREYLMKTTEIEMGGYQQDTCPHGWALTTTICTICKTKHDHDMLLGALKRLCSKQPRTSHQIDVDWDNARAVINSIEGINNES